ncbi:MAG TPA: hypothetical protein VHW67_06665 [Solirubrobacteraceae bacterium]|nr:hypothetical protein [Solirubrobacteraceae bacterium]
MSTHPRNTSRAARFGPRRAGLWLLSISAAGLLAAVPSASAVGAPSAAVPSVTPAAVTVSSGDLASLDVSALGLDSGQLASVLARIPALGALPAGTLETVLGALPSNTPLSGLLTAIETATGIKVSIGEVTSVVVGDAAIDPSVLTNLLADLASMLEGTPQGTELAQVLENLLGGLSTEQLQQLANQLGVSGDPAELASTLEQKLASGELLPALESLLAQLGTPLETTAEQLEGALGTTPAELAGELGLPESLLNTVTGIEAPIGGTDGLLTALVGQEGTTVGTVPRSTTSTSIGSTTNNSTTNNYASTPPPAAVAAAKKAAAGKVKILRHKVKGHTLTLVLKTPSAGRITVTAAHARRVSKKVAQAATTTLKLALTKAGVADVKGRHKLNLKVKVAFKPTSGAASTAVTQAHFR